MCARAGPGGAGGGGAGAHTQEGAPPETTGERKIISIRLRLCVRSVGVGVALRTRLLEFNTRTYHGSDSRAHSSDSSPYLRLSARSTMASWMALATSREVGASVLLRG